jgi:hypothetical protein
MPADERAELVSGAAALAAHLFGVVPSESDPTGTETSFAMLHGLYWLPANLALRQPTLLVVDDVHWADEPWLRWLVYLARRLERLPLLVVAATRPTTRATVIRPAALGRESAVMLAQGCSGFNPRGLRRGPA